LESRRRMTHAGDLIKREGNRKECNMISFVSGEGMETGTKKSGDQSDGERKGRERGVQVGSCKSRGNPSACLLKREQKKGRKKRGDQREIKEQKKLQGADREKQEGSPKIGREAQDQGSKAQ